MIQNAVAIIVVTPTIYSPFSINSTIFRHFSSNLLQITLAKAVGVLISDYINLFFYCFNFSSASVVHFLKLRFAPLPPLPELRKQWKNLTKNLGKQSKRLF